VSVNKLESLLDAIASVNGWANPDSEAYHIHNPLLISNYSLPGKNEIDEKGRRVFKTAASGVHSCLYDLSLKVKGESRAGIKKDDLLENLLRVYGLVELGGQQQVVKFLRRALKDQSITVETPLSYFREGI
jgi:hypothetical protein